MKENKKAFLFVFFIAAISLSSIFLFQKEAGEKAEISIDGKVVKTIDLKTAKNQIIDLTPFGEEIQIEVKDCKIRFLSSDCPNQTCVSTGFIKDKGQTAVCLPNKTAITIIKT